MIGFFVFLALSCMSCLYILQIYPLAVVSFDLVFSHSDDCLFTLLIVSIAVKNLFKFNQVPLVYFYFYFLYSRRWVIEDLALFMPSGVLLMLSSKNFIVSGLTFRSLIQLEFLFVFGVRKYSNFILLHVAV